ncbi:MAG: nicotinate-nucleotide--dimethylbenzimidazole phosphoribosyltransferase, partial [Acidobacteriota bacterium]
MAPLTRCSRSPAVITRALVEYCGWPLTLFNAGLNPEHLKAASVTLVDLVGQTARCLSTGHALPQAVVKHLFQQGLEWGEHLGRQRPDTVLGIGECVVGGTTTALAVLLGLGVAAGDKVNSSHRICNHQQKYQLAQQGLRTLPPLHDRDPLAIVAAVGDPMQPVVAGMAIAASRHAGVLLAGGTQMLAVYTLAAQAAQTYQLPWCPEAVVIGTTPWVATDSSGNTLGLLEAIAATVQNAQPR